MAIDLGNVQGPPGLPGQGVTAGGTSGQVLTKNSSTDYDTVWIDNTADIVSFNSSGLPTTASTAQMAIAEALLKIDHDRNIVVDPTDINNQPPFRITDIGFDPRGVYNVNFTEAVAEGFNMTFDQYPDMNGMWYNMGLQNWDNNVENYDAEGTNYWMHESGDWVMFYLFDTGNGAPESYWFIRYAGFRYDPWNSLDRGLCYFSQYSPDPFTFPTGSNPTLPTLWNSYPDSGVFTNSSATYVSGTQQSISWNLLTAGGSSSTNIDNITITSGGAEGAIQAVDLVSYSIPLTSTDTSFISLTSTMLLPEQQWTNTLARNDNNLYSCNTSLGLELNSTNVYLAELEWRLNNLSGGTGEDTFDFTELFNESPTSATTKFVLFTSDTTPVPGQWISRNNLDQPVTMISSFSGNWWQLTPLFPNIDSPALQVNNTTSATNISFDVYFSNSDIIESGGISTGQYGGFLTYERKYVYLAGIASAINNEYSYILYADGTSTVTQLAQISNTVGTQPWATATESVGEIPILPNKNIIGFGFSGICPTVIAYNAQLGYGIKPITVAIKTGTGSGGGAIPTTNFLTSATIYSPDNSITITSAPGQYNNAVNLQVTNPAFPITLDQYDTSGVINADWQIDQGPYTMQAWIAKLANMLSLAIDASVNIGGRLNDLETQTGYLIDKNKPITQEQLFYLFAFDSLHTESQPSLTFTENLYPFFNANSPLLNSTTFGLGNGWYHGGGQFGLSSDTSRIKVVEYNNQTSSFTANFSDSNLVANPLPINSSLDRLIVGYNISDFWSNLTSATSGYGNGGNQYITWNALYSDGTVTSSMSRYILPEYWQDGIPLTVAIALDPGKFLVGVNVSFAGTYINQYNTQFYLNISQIEAFVTPPLQLANGTIGNSYSAQTYVPTSGMTCTLQVGPTLPPGSIIAAFPPGLTMDSGGIITGNPTTAGTYVFSVIANISGTNTLNMFSITIS